MDRSTSKRVPVGRLVMKKFDVLPEKDHLLYVGLNKVGSSSSNQIHIAHRLVQKNHLEFDCNDAGVAAVRDVVQPPQDASITIVPTKVRQQSDDGKSMTEHDLRLNTWSELKSGARVKIGNLISLIYEPFDVKDLPVAGLNRAGSSSRVQTSVDLGQQITRSFGDRDVTRSYDHSRYSQKSRSTGLLENLAQETTASSSRVPSSQGEEEQRPVYERHILRELGLEPGMNGEQESQEYEHNVPDDELCTLSLCEMTESYLSYFDSYNGEDDLDYDRSSRKGKGRATDSATDSETTPPRARVQVPFRMLPPELTRPSAYFLAQSIPEEEILASNTGGSNQEETEEEPEPNEEHEEAGENNGASDEAGDEEGTNEEVQEEEATKESDKTLQIPKQSTKEDPSQASTSTSASASGPTLLSSQDFSPRTSPKKASPKFVADGPDSENIEPSASRSQSVSPDKRSSKPMGPPVGDTPRQLRARTRASVVKLTKIDGNKDGTTNNASRRSDSSGAPTPLANPEAANVASEPLAPAQKRSRSRSTYHHDTSRPGGKIGRRRK